MVNNGRTHGESESSTNGVHGVGRRTFLKVTGAGATGTALAGCLGGGGGGGGGSSEGLKVGHLGPMSSPLGRGSFRSAKMAASKINEAGGVNGGDVKIIEGNTQASPSEAQSVVEEFINQENVDFLIGVFASEVALALVDLTAEMGVPLLVTGSASPQVTAGQTAQNYDKYKNIFRVGPINSDLQAEAMAGYAGHLKELHGWDQLAFLRDNATWTRSFERDLPGYLQERDIEVVYNSALSIDNPDLSSVMDEVAATEADYILRFFAHIDGSPMLANWHDAQYEYGIEGIHVTGMFPSYFEATQGAALYETTAQTGAAGVASITEKTKPFRDAYQNQYGDAEKPPFKAPMYMGFSTYDGINIVSEVTNTLGESPKANLDAFVDEMLKVNHTGVAGQIEFYGPDSKYPHDLKEVRGDSGDIVNYPVTQWQEGGSLECVYPQRYQTAEHVMPQWMR